MPLQRPPVVLLAFLPPRSAARKSPEIAGRPVSKQKHVLNCLPDTAALNSLLHTYIS